jgi:cytochrome b subunit of formate dehydrogenase
VSSEADGDAGESTDGGYVHVPGEADNGEGGRSGDNTAGSEPEADGFGRKGWALTAVLFTCVLVIPGIIYVYPYAAGALGFSFFATYLALPLIPAVLLGAVAVWSMTAATRDQ